MTGVSLNPANGTTGANNLQSDNNFTQKAGLDALMERPTFTFAGANSFNSDTMDVSRPQIPGIMDVNYDSKGNYLNGSRELGPIITVTGPPRMKTEWSQLTLLEQVQWAALALTTSALAADIAMKTDLTGDNPDNPYISAQEQQNRFQRGMQEPPPSSSGR